MEEILAITFIFGGGSIFLFAISPIGKAIAARIQGHGPHSTAVARKLEEMEHWMAAEMEAMRQELTEVQERLDFTERLIARREEAKLPPVADDSH